MRTITELRAQTTNLTTELDRNKCGLVSEINHLSRVLSSLGPVLSGILTRINCSTL